MGTHGLLCIRKAKTIKCVERTLDGYQYVELFLNFLKQLNNGTKNAMKYLEQQLNRERIPMSNELFDIRFLRTKDGRIKMNVMDEYREQEQEYVLMVDRNKRIVYVSGNILGAIGIDGILNAHRILRKHKWTLDIGYEVDALIYDGVERELYEAWIEQKPDYPMREVRNRYFRFVEVWTK